MRGEGGGGAGDDVDQVHHLPDFCHLCVRHCGLGEEQQVECLLGRGADPIRAARPFSGRPAAQWAGLPKTGAAWVRADMKETVPPSSWPSAVPSPATVSSTRAYP
ncbi:hypothetical protein [Streptomyces sp. NPDC059460]|uniref:hypothetical protein n=1 Tax=Streptomyces sp. NPDC059460 TaxID=3346840 RepID=UPI003690945E